jgi:hypothetical protein
MNETQMENRGRTRERGMSRYVAGTGGPFGPVMFVSTSAAHFPSPTPKALAVSAVPNAIGGTLFGVGTWCAREFLYGRALTRGAQR